MTTISTSVVDHQGVKFINKVAFLQILLPKFWIFKLYFGKNFFFAQLLLRLLWLVIQVSFDGDLFNSLHFSVNIFGNLISRFILLRKLSYFICLSCLLWLVRVFNAFLHHLFHYSNIILTALAGVWVFEIKGPSLNCILIALSIGKEVGVDLLVKGWSFLCLRLCLEF